MKASIFVFLIIMGVFSEGQELLNIKVCYTQWFNRDSPTGFGDYETLDRLRVEYPGMICLKPLTIEATTLSGLSASSTGQVFEYYDPVHGFACVNSQQKLRNCLNYKVRFGCRCPWPLLHPRVAM
ncbi:cartilage intermediate layer protein 1-like isoform X1 [Silurus meridionalis]|nr:cartilage intermediate layer protein 1-like isoform X1 [Silurus meridionalis]